MVPCACTGTSLRRKEGTKGKAGRRVGGRVIVTGRHLDEFVEDDLQVVGVDLTGAVDIKKLEPG